MNFHMQSLTQYGFSNAIWIKVVWGKQYAKIRHYNTLTETNLGSFFNEHNELKSYSGTTTRYQL